MEDIVDFEGYSVMGIISQLNAQYIMCIGSKDVHGNDDNDTDTMEENTSVISDVAKAEISLKMAEVETCLREGASEKLQLLSLCSFIMTTVRQEGGMISSMVEEEKES